MGRMAKQTTTIRLDARFRKAIVREAKKAGLNFSDIVNLLLRAFVDGTVQIGVTQYPKGYIEKLHKEADALNNAFRKGKVRSYASGKELFNDILNR